MLDRLCVTDDYSSSDQSELDDFTDGDSFELDGDDIYDIGVFDSNDQSESENYAPTYDNLESEYDSSSMIPDQPRKRPINIGREAPISLRVQEKAWLKKLQNSYKTKTMEILENLVQNFLTPKYFYLRLKGPYRRVGRIRPLTNFEPF